MKIRTSMVAALVLGVALSVGAAHPGHSQPDPRNKGAVGGYGKLPWGTTAEQAQAVYRDLYFRKYVVEDDGRKPIGIYYRRTESEEMDGVAFDDIEYRFRENRFCGIRAVMRSRIGPRSLITRSEESFSELRDALARKHGRPTGYSESYFTEFVTVTRVVRWELPDATIVLTYRGPETTNEDQLIFELREGERR